MKRVTKQSGFTLIEVLVATALFLSISAMMAPAFMLHLKVNLNSERKSDAVAAAQRVMDELRSTTIQSLPQSGSGTPIYITLNNRDFKVTPNYCVRGGLCSERSRHIVLTVENKAKKIYEVETVFTNLR